MASVTPEKLQTLEKLRTENRQYHKYNDCNGQKKTKSLRCTHKHIAKYKYSKEDKNWFNKDTSAFGELKEEQTIRSAPSLTGWKRVSPIKLLCYM